MPKIPAKKRAIFSALLGVALVASAPRASAESANQPAAQPGTAPAGAAPSANGEARAACGASYEQAQTDKLAGRYIAAKAAALACSQIECNAVIVRECVKLYDALERETPTLIVSARVAQGDELADVRVEMDGQLVAERVTGRPFVVDPGPHDFVFIHPKLGRVELVATARVGDRARTIEATFVDPNAKKQPPPGAPSPVANAAPARSGIPVMSYVLGGIGVAGLGGFVAMRLSAVSAYNEYGSTCSPACNPDDIAAVGTKFTISYVSLGVGAASLAGAVLVFALSRGDGKAEVQASITPRPDGAVAGFRTRF